MMLDKTQVSPKIEVSDVRFLTEINIADNLQTLVL